MREQIHKELAVLQEELSKLDPAVKHIQDAEKLARNITNTGEELQVKYDEQLKAVQQLTVQYQELVEKSEKVIRKIDQVDFPNRLDKLDSAVTGINQGVQNTQLKLENLSHEIISDFKEIKSTATSVNQGVQNTQLKLENVGHEIIDGVKEAKADLNQKIEANRKEIHILKILAFSGIIIGVVIIIMKFAI